MCGIAGFTFAPGSAPERRRALHGPAVARMAASLRHRGPDAQEALLLDGCALGHARLAIVDLAGGRQPMRDPQTGVALTFNGEIFNYVELRAELAAQGRRFATTSDTEVLLQAYLARGIDCVRDFIGQFSFALWDPRDRALHLARDPVGITPLFYAQRDGQLAFASEVKALYAAGRLAPALDPVGVKQTLSLWAPVEPRTAFEGVYALPPGCVARFAGGRLEVKRYWDVDLDPARVREDLSEARALEELDALLNDAVRLRLRADVPVAAYLSGGLDSSVLCALANRQLGGTLQTYSVAFAQARFDERRYQEEVVRALGTRHASVEVADRDIGALLPEVTEHAEQVLLRTAPAPFHRLSALVRERGTKVVLTGEGSDEIFWGYDLFKETRVRQFWARQPDSALRPLLLRRLYPSLPLAQQPASALKEFFGRGLEHPDDPAFSHRVRWESSGRVARFLAPAFAARAASEDPAQSRIEAMPEQARRWPALARAQYLEMHTLLSGYLLSAQGDRMLMAHGVEGRFPFLDHRLIAFAARLPARLKLAGLKEKVLLRHYARGRVPEAVLARVKFPYRAPVAGSMVGAEAAPWAREALAPEAVAATGVFDPDKVRRLVAKLAEQPAAASEADAMALVAVGTTQLLDRRVLRAAPPPEAAVAAVRLEVA